MRQNERMRRSGSSFAPVRFGALALIGVLALVACGDDGSGNAQAESLATAAASLPVTDDTAPATAAPTTVRATTTTVRPTTTTTSTTTTTTLAPTTLAPTTVVTLPVPAAPPAPRADEPYVELGTIEIPKIGVAKTLLEGISLNTLDVGPGHWPGTAMPGQLGNSVIAGHRTSHDKPFRHIDQLVPGDEVIFTTADGRFVYQVTGTTIVTPDAMYIIDQTPDATATLFACHPVGSTKQRIVVSLALVA